MVGPIAQLVALACHGNAALRGTTSTSRLLQDNSTCQFCEYVHFVRVTKSWLGKPKEVAVADSPEAWFAALAAQRASGIRLVHESSADPAMPDHMSAGFVGGGGRSALIVRHGDSVDVWLARWTVGNPQAADRRIWQVTYGLVGTMPPSPAASLSLQAAHASLRKALEEIHAFATEHKSEHFAKCFATALEALRDYSSRPGYHRDLYVDGTLSETSRALLEAAQPAWVFGGMGSWNDQYFEGATPEEYSRLSSQLYEALLNAICAATNESDRGTRDQR